MKKLIILCILTAMFLVNAQAQTAQASGKIKATFVPSVDVGIGYIPNMKYRKMTISTATTNLLWNRVGTIVTFEVNFDTPALMVGPTYSIFKKMYVFAEMDFITSRGVFAQDGIKGARKDVGIGINPWPWALAKVAYSDHAKLRAEVGLRVPLSRE